MRVTVDTGARLHFGFRNLALERDRLFGSLGVGLDEPRTVVTAEPASRVICSHDDARRYADRVVSTMGVDGARVTVESTLPRHAGLGSGTQLALATLTAVARAHEEPPRVRDRATVLGRGRRSGVGVATFEHGGFVVDAGHPVERVATDGGEGVDVAVPPVVVRRSVPEKWRFLLVLPDATPGKSGADEAESMAAVIERADPAVADRIAATVTRRVVPALEAEQVASFGAGVATVDLLNGSWFVHEQGDVYRPPVGAIIGELTECDAVFGAGQSSWGPAVYGVTTVEHADAAHAAGHRALTRAGVDGRVCIAAPRNHGAITYTNNQIIKY